MLESIIFGLININSNDQLGIDFVLFRPFHWSHNYVINLEKRENLFLHFFYTCYLIPSDDQNIC
jgi:hypothetical protein